MAKDVCVFLRWASGRSNGNAGLLRLWTHSLFVLISFTHALPFPPPLPPTHTHTFFGTQSRNMMIAREWAWRWAHLYLLFPFLLASFYPVIFFTGHHDPVNITVCNVLLEAKQMDSAEDPKNSVLWQRIIGADRTIAWLLYRHICSTWCIMVYHLYLAGHCALHKHLNRKLSVITWSLLLRARTSHLVYLASECSAVSARGEKIRRDG